MNAGIQAKDKEGSHFRALTDLELNAKLISSDMNELVNIQHSKGKGIPNGDYQRGENYRHNNGQVDSGVIYKGPLNELGFRNTTGSVRFINVNSGSIIGSALTSKRFDDAKHMD